MPENIGKYRILDRIGQGAMGEVFRAHDSVLDRPVALKIIAAGDEERRQRFRREAQSAAKLTHPNIVIVHDFGEHSGRFYMAMELLDGRDLKHAIIGNAFGTVDARLHVMEQVCDAMAFAHAQHIIHRDLKPANIFLLPAGQVKILDFGLARVGQSDMTGTGMILGTPNYMAPEQIRGESIDSRADIFSLGAVFYELLSSRKAFEADSLHGVLYKVLQHEPEPLQAGPVSNIVRKALAKAPNDRFQDVREMRDAIRSARGGSSPSISSPSISFLSPSMAAKPRFDTGTVVIDAVSLDAVPVVFAGELGGDLTVTSKRAQTLLEASLGAKIPHAHECGGNARCSTCRVLVVEGGHNLSPRDSAELKLARRLGFGDDVRLACQTKVMGPAKVRRLILDADDIRIATTANATSGHEVPLAVLHASIREMPLLLRRNVAHDVVHILNRYYLQVGEAVLANSGHIDRYHAGGIVALFGVDGSDAGTKCTNAVRAALRMQRRMAVFNEYLREHFGMTFTLDIGLHYGRMIVGQIGHPDHLRLTAVGDATGIAGAVADVNRRRDGAISATEEIVNVIESDIATGDVSHEILGGREREYAIYEVLDFAKPDTHYLVQSSFEAIAARREEAARMFYDKLFEIAPQVRPLFAHVDLHVQGAMLMNMLAAAVKGLDRLDELKPVLEDLGRRHAGYGAEVGHYAAVEACLLYTIEKMMGKEFNLDVKLAWTHIYNFIAATMIDAAATA
jgi:hemoglobin-like flavoprotein/ferredoxin